MTDNTNDAEKTPKPRTPRKPGKTADAVTPKVAAEAAGAADAKGAEKARRSRRAKPAEEASKPGRARRTGSAESTGPVESVKSAKAKGEPVEVVAEAPDSGRPPSSEQAERDARAAWFERAERVRREERTGWTPWARPGEREERAGRDERVREEQVREERVREERAEGGKDPLGTAAEEAFKLFDTLQQKATRELRKNLIKGTMTGFGSAFSGGGRGRERDVWEEAVSEHEEYICRACPVCRAMAAQRESGTAVTDHLMQAGTELFAAFKSAVDGLGKSAPGQRTRERERKDTPVEHIDLG
ncbi:DUF5304 domain-containing protein [Streptosporangium sp. NBC_01810]|uniref:hypothetical protein n=1 Tax=Streptosporangium sp. NBC_01810 TaxID=2975951 RepID=UPI002DD9721B|nr:hypothetical protein [Streptosporangium sp. NBC_01810]WSA22961.1 DUF5304 domain-containing protein [Streptosporangium sp. NBC_01810]